MKTIKLTVVMLFASLVSFANTNNVENSTTTTLPQTETETNTIEEEYYIERRFSSITEIGTTFAYGIPYFTVYQAVGIRVNPHLFIGQGVGIQAAKNNIYQIQTTADIRAYILDRKVTPLFGLQMGINKVGNSPVVETNKQLKDLQFILNAGSGVLIQAKENAAFTLTGGYTLLSDFNNYNHGGYIKIGYVF